MRINRDGVDVFVPDGVSVDEALSRTTHLGIGAHPDDLEIMAFHGIASCYKNSSKWFSGVVCTDGAGSARSGPFSDHSSEQIVKVRREEQRKAASVGKYSVVLQMAYSSREATSSHSDSLVDDLSEILSTSRPEIVYTHNLADQHATHVAIGVSVVKAIRMLPVSDRPSKLYGCEVWRSLDWLSQEAKATLDLGSNERLAKKLLSCFRSQIVGGKRYDRAALGRWRSNATFSEALAVDRMALATYAMDLTLLIENDERDIASFVMDYVKQFSTDVEQRVKAHII